MGRYLPAIVMVVLIIVSLSAMQLPDMSESAHHISAWQSWLVSAEGAGMLVAALCVAGLHLWRRNALLSIAVGTGLYMAWLQLGGV